MKTTLTNADFMVGSQGGLDYLIVGKMPNGSKLGVKPLVPFHIRVRLQRDEGVDEDDLTQTGLALEPKSEHHASQVIAITPDSDLVEAAQEKLKGEVSEQVKSHNALAEKSKENKKGFKALHDVPLVDESKTEEAGVSMHGIIDELTRGVGVASVVADDLLLAAGDGAMASKAQIVEHLNRGWRKIVKLDPDEFGALGAESKLKVVSETDEVDNVVEMAHTKKAKNSKAKKPKKTDS